MENGTNLDSKKNLKVLIISIISGIIIVLAGISIYLGIFYTTKDYRLVKNNYDVYLNEDKKDLTSNDAYYYLDKDSSYFVVNNDEVTIDVTKVKENNPSFLDDDYFIDVAFYLKIDGYTGYETDLPSVTLSSNDTNVIKDRTIRYYINGTTTISKLYFNNNISKISLKLSSLELSSGAVASFNNVRFAFYSYVR